jgi:hypothetical protein
MFRIVISPHVSPLPQSSVGHSTREGFRVKQKILQAAEKSLIGFVALNRLLPPKRFKPFKPFKSFKVMPPLSLFEQPAKRSSFTLAGAML